jgi:two-component system chemotaxis sensor kinase CheA
MSELQEASKEFLIETNENLAQLDLDLVTLEQDPTERETLARVFRTLHTIKGTAGFLGLQKLQAVAHAGENLLTRLREGKLVFNRKIANALLAVVDAVRKMLAAVETNETDGDGDYSELVGVLAALQTETPNVPATAAAATHTDRTVAYVTTDGPPPDSAETRAPSIADTAIRVDVGLLDKLMNLVGELVLARNQIVQVNTAQENPALTGTVQRLNLLTTELQTGVMKTRMQPIGTIWSKFPRIVRDLAVACGKQARLEMDGQDTELDKSIIEAIRDPLTHLVRNAIDHGIESPTERSARGKPAEGRLALFAFHEGGKVHIEIADDGAGIDPERVRAKAQKAQLITAEQAERLNNEELLRLIFLPGFSTADRVTQFSGRGVGMDVVLTNIEKIGGTVAIDSRPGQGTTVRMKIPLTLAIIPALTITSGRERYAIPQVNLLELVRLEGDQAGRGVERIHGAPVYRLRGNLLPLVYLNHELGLSTSSGADVAVNIVVLQADDRQFGLVVDAIHDTEEIVVKPLQKQLKSLNVFAGATIMGDGRVALILDVVGLAQKARVISAHRERALPEKPAEATQNAGDRQTVLLFAARDGGRMAVPLSRVSRLEEFPRSAVEKVGRQMVVQYRDEILPLIDVARLIRLQGQQSDREAKASPVWQSPHGNGSDPVSVIVCVGQGQRIGLIVDRILDIAEEAIVSRSGATRPGILFTAVIQGRVTEFLDLETLVRSAEIMLRGPAAHIVRGELAHGR